ncbi:MAG: efflux RND transporter periplasmic adaptor subunit [Myxococcota bacterium]|nr:efflux RND transporter periplasmic adaptor subunit [Myxococcota bacterium]
MKRLPIKRLAVALIVLGALVVLRGPLSRWFMLAEANPGLVSKPTTVQQPPTHRFSEVDFQALKIAFMASEKLRLALSLDQVEPLKELSSGLGQALAGLQPADLDDALSLSLAAAGSAAQAIAQSGDAESARVPYGELQQALFALAQADPRLQKGWTVFTCPMAPGFQRWFQTSGELENPYMGQKMLRCGSPSAWVVESQPEESAASGDDISHYTCSMHPSVHQKVMGLCPICNMDLTPVTFEDLSTGDVLVDSVRRQRIGVRTEELLRRRLTRSIGAVGELTWDESRIEDVTARVDGWVEKLTVKRQGDKLESGAELLRYYSPDLLATQRELLASPRGSALADIASERLQLWGMSRADITALTRRKKVQKNVILRSPISGIVLEKHINQGARLKSGALLYRIADPSRLWVEAKVFEQDLQHLKAGQKVSVELPHAANENRQALIAYVYPQLDSQSRTGRLRIELDNADGRLRPGMLAQLKVEVELGEHLAIPHQAVIVTGARRIVFVDKGEGRLRPIEVKLGARAGDYIIVNEGLSEGDIVVTSGIFLIAAESRIRSAAEYWEASDEPAP